MPISKLSFTQTAQIKFIEREILLLGKTSRHAIVEHFDCSTASATRILAKYREIAPNNIVLVHEDKSYVATSTFKPMFVSTSNDLFLGEKEYSHFDNLLSSLTPSPLQLISGLSKAISQSLILSISYSSPSLTTTVFDFIPHSLFKINNEQFVRGFNRSNNQFQHLRCTWIEILGAAHSDSEVLTSESKSNDSEWLIKKRLKLSAHSSLFNKKSIELQFDMLDSTKYVEVRKALLCDFASAFKVDGLQDFVDGESGSDFLLFCNVVN
ncbi:MAG: hypothetical protein ACI88H_000471 [Cocleimonas sp.]